VQTQPVLARQTHRRVIRVMRAKSVQRNSTGEKAKAFERIGIANCVYRACPKVACYSFFANFSRTTERHDIKFYTLVAHSLVR